MAKSIKLDEKIRKQLLDVFENLKDEYVPNSADSVLTLLDIKDSIENNSLTFEQLSKLKSCEKYAQVMNIFRRARVQFDLSKYKGE